MAGNGGEPPRDCVVSDLFDKSFSAAMFKHQLIAETFPSIHDRMLPASLNDASVVLRLLEQNTGFGQFRVVLPGEVIWAPGASSLRGAGPAYRATLEQAVLDYVADDRARVVDTIRAAIADRKGFHFTARMQAGPKVRVVEVIGDVKVEDGSVTELYGFVRDISAAVEREAMALSRARLIRSMVEDMPVPVVVLDRALRVMACSVDWARGHGLSDRASALRQPLGKLVDLSRETTAAIIEALNGRTAHIGLWFHSSDGQLQRRCAVIPWQCGADAAGGVLMVIGDHEASFATAEIADRALSQRAGSLLQMLETFGGAAA